MDLNQARNLASSALGVAEDLASAAGQPTVALVLDEMGRFLNAVDAGNPAESERQALIRAQRILSDEIARREANS